MKKNKIKGTNFFVKFQVQIIVNLLLIIIVAYFSFTFFSSLNLKFFEKENQKINNNIGKLNLDIDNLLSFPTISKLDADEQAAKFEAFFDDFHKINVKKASYNNKGYDYIVSGSIARLGSVLYDLQQDKKLDVYYKLSKMNIAGSRLTAQFLVYGRSKRGIKDFTKDKKNNNKEKTIVATNLTVKPSEQQLIEQNLVHQRNLKKIDREIEILKARTSLAKTIEDCLDSGACNPEQYKLFTNKKEKVDNNPAPVPVVPVTPVNPPPINVQRRVEEDTAYVDLDKLRVSMIINSNIYFQGINKKFTIGDYLDKEKTLFVSSFVDDGVVIKDTSKIPATDTVVLIDWFESDDTR